MHNKITLTYDIDATNYNAAGEASSNVKKTLKQLGTKPDVIRKVAIAMYEGEINMVIHANGGKATVEIEKEKIEIMLKDQGPGIPNVDLAMKEGYSTASVEARNLGFGAGMGLPNIKKYTDDMKIETTIDVGTTLFLTFYC